MSAKKPADTMPTKKPDEMMLLKPCNTMSSEKPADTIYTNQQGGTMVIKPCKTISTRKQDDKSLLIKPCETITERSVKKRRVMSTVVEEEVEVEDNDDEEENEKEEKDDDEGMQPDSMAPCHEFEQGKHIDLEALLSTKARNFLVTTKGGEIVHIASLQGNYVLVCCFLIPFKTHSSGASICRNLEALYSKLSLNGMAQNVKLVVVAKIATGFDEADFESFFSNVSFDCLAIPFSDSTSRDTVCESFGFYPQSISFEAPCLAVDPSGTVLQFDHCFLFDYGTESFPFTNEHFVNIMGQDKIIRQRLRSTDSPISLSELLKCDYLSRITDEDSRVQTSNLGDTIAALYIYIYGDFMVKLQDIHKKCVDEGHKFEIVLVPVPFERHYDPASFYNLMKQSALKNSTRSSWLVFPFNDKISRTFWRLFDCLSEDQLIILPNGDRPGDLLGRHIATSYGIDAYPFTRDVIIDRKVNEIRSVSLEQLVGDTHKLGLHNKNVLLYLDHPTFGNGAEYPYQILDLDYCEFKAKYPCSEVVFVPFSPIVRYKNGGKGQMCKTKWPILPGGMCESVMKHIYGNGCVYRTLVTFGKDGKILSRSAQYNQPGWDSSVSLFDDTLALEILSDLEKESQEAAD